MKFDLSNVISIFNIFISVVITYVVYKMNRYTNYQNKTVESKYKYTYIPIASLLWKYPTHKRLSKKEIKNINKIIAHINSIKNEVYFEPYLMEFANNYSKEKDHKKKRCIYFKFRIRFFINRRKLQTRLDLVGESFKYMDETNHLSSKPNSPRYRWCRKIWNITKYLLMYNPLIPIIVISVSVFILVTIFQKIIF